MIDQLSYPLISLAGITRQLIAIKPICNKMDAFLTEATVNQFEKELQGFQSEIQFQDVSFGYGEQPPVLSNFSFTIKKECVISFKVQVDAEKPQRSICC